MTQSLLERTARAMYREDPGVRRTTDFDSLPTADQKRYLKLASVALAITLREPVDLLETIPVS